jgi:hypothetical protein
VSRTVKSEQSRYVVGLDLGQKRDYSAIALLEVVETVYVERDPVTWAPHRDAKARLGYLERVSLGTPYPDVVKHVAEFVSDARLKDSTLVVDATGVGAPVVDLLRRQKLPCSMIPVTITSGEAAHSSQGGGYHVPKRELLTGLQVLVQQGGLVIPRSLLLAEAFVSELVGMREGSRDDLALATSLAWWWARRNGGLTVGCWRGAVLVPGAANGFRY